MPAATADPVSLPRVALTVRSHPRSVKSVTTAPSGFEGEGFPVYRAFAGVSLADLDPFIHMDQMGEVEYAPGEPKGTPWHPHRGFETVTYLLDGAFLHQDSHGGGGLITDGATQWMTAGSGILHIETPPEELVMSGGLFHGIQLWVNLPKSLKWSDPAYQNLEADQVQLLASADAGTLIRLIAGSLQEFQGPGSTKTPISVIHATISPGAELNLPYAPTHTALVYALSGEGTVGVDRAPIRTGQLAVLNRDGHSVTVAASPTQESRHSNGLDVLILGGEPIRENVVQMGPFVMNSKSEVIQAFEDYQKGRLGTVPADAIQPFRVG